MLTRVFHSNANTAQALSRALGWPTRTLLGGGVVVAGVRELGLRQDIASLIGGIGAGMVIVGATFIAYFLVSAVGSWLAGRAALTETKVDEIAVAIGSGIAKFFVIVTGIVAAAEVLGLPYEGVIAGLGVGGLALAIAARDAVSNFIGAGILMADKPFKRGDLIELNGQIGTVEDVGLRSTQIRTLDDALLTVPNSKLADDTVSNWTRQRTSHVLLKICVVPETSGSALDAFVAELKPLFANQPLGSDKDLFIGISGFGPNSIDITVDGYLLTADYTAFIDARHRLIADIIALARRLDIAVAMPTQTLHIASRARETPLRTTLPATAEAAA